MALQVTVRNWLTRLRGARYRASLYASMHRGNRFKGVTWRDYVDEFLRLIPERERRRVLDFGCGPRGGLAEALGDSAIPYDPYVERYASGPWDRQFDVVFSSDVLEHMTPSEIREFVRKVNDSTARYLFLAVSTRPAVKCLPNGANAHLTVRSADWWLVFLKSALHGDFSLLLARDDLLRDVAVFCFQREHPRKGATRAA